MIPAAARVMRCYPLDEPGVALEDTFARFDALWRDDPAPPPAFLDELSFAVAAAWVRTFWTLPEVARCHWLELFGSDHGTRA